MKDYYTYLGLLYVCSFLTICLNGGTPKNDIVVENLKQGTKDWWQGRVDSYSLFSSPVSFIQGFSTRFSYSPADTVHFKISVELNAIKSYKIQIYRLGYYSGDGGRLVGSLAINSIATSKQPRCDFEEASRMTDCANWQVSSQWTIPSDAVSGVYIALPSAIIKDDVVYGNYIPFVVRQASNKIGSTVLFKTSDLTWVAYNLYGGYNVYRGNGSRAFSSRAWKASYNRPFTNRMRAPQGQHQNFLFGSEYPMLYWLEQYGYDISYVSCSDFEDLYRGNSLVGRYNVLLSLGHDEYWTAGTMAAHYVAREGGINLAFFSGNEAFWRVLWSNASSYSTTTTTNNSNSNRIALTPTGTTGTTGTMTSASNDVGLSVFSDGDDTSQYGDRNYRIIICRKESIDNVPAIPSSGTAPLEHLQIDSAISTLYPPYIPLYPPYIHPISLYIHPISTLYPPYIPPISLYIHPISPLYPPYIPLYPPYIHPISTLYPPYIHRISTVYPPYIHPISTLYPPYIHPIDRKSVV